MKPLFQDPLLQQRADTNGYVVVPLLSPAQVETLRTLFAASIDQNAIHDLYESSRHNALEANLQINRKIGAEIERSGQGLFAPCQFYGGTFMVKSHHDSTVLPLHQDWSVVEENQYATWFLWCPLQPVNSLNGGLFVVDASHRYFDNLRSGSYPSDRFLLPTTLEHAIKPIALDAGEAIIYSDRLFHGSYANNGGVDRVVVTGRVVEPGVSLVYFHRKNERQVDVYASNEALYLSQIDRLAKGEAPAGASKLYTREYRHRPVTAESLRERVRENTPPQSAEPAACRLFEDPQLEDAFQRDGYVLIDLIDRPQVEELLSFYRRLDHAPPPQYGFQVSLDNQRADFVQAVSTKLMATLKPLVDRKFRDHQLFTASFVVKHKNPLGVVPPHQDWTFVDEQRYWSATIWCPLVDTSLQNGALGVIAASHRFYNHVRPSPSPQYEPPFKDQLFTIFPYLKIIEMKAGQALVFDNRTLHASLPNALEETRVSIGLGITHKDAELRHYYLLPRQDRPIVEQYSVSPEFFYRYNNARLAEMHTRGEQPGDLNSTGRFAYTCEQYDERRLQALMEAAGNVRNEPLVQAMADVFGYNPDGTRNHSNEPNRAYRDAPPWWKVYTPLNICREIQYRIRQSFP